MDFDKEIDFSQSDLAELEKRKARIDEQLSELSDRMIKINTKIKLKKREMGL